jgi:hypothetical protein
MLARSQNRKAAVAYLEASGATSSKIIGTVVTRWWLTAAMAPPVATGPQARWRRPGPNQRAPAQRTIRLRRQHGARTFHGLLRFRSFGGWIAGCSITQDWTAGQTRLAPPASEPHMLRVGLKLTLVVFASTSLKFSSQ